MSQELIAIIGAAIVAVALATPVYAQGDCADWNTAAFFEAAEVSDVTRCLQMGANLDARDADGTTPLHWAASFGTADTVTALLVAGADPDVQDEFFVTPLHNAASSGNVKTVMALLEAGAYLEARFVDGGPPLHVAKTAEVVMALLVAGADPHTRTRYGVTPAALCAICRRRYGAGRGRCGPEREDERWRHPSAFCKDCRRRDGATGSGRRSGGARTKWAGPLCITWRDTPLPTL